MRNNEIKVLNEENDVVVINGNKVTHIEFVSEDLVRINGKAYFVYIVGDRINFRFIPEEDSLDLSNENYDGRYDVEGGDIL